MAIDPGMLSAADTYLQPNDYWTNHTTSASDGGSWWNQTNWFHKKTSDDEPAEVTLPSEAAGTATVFNRFGTIIKTASSESHEEQKTEQEATQQQKKKRKQMKLTGIGGCRKEVMSQITDTIVLPLQHPTLFKAIGVPPSIGVLISGASGSGKTAVIDSLRKELDVYYQRVDGAELLASADGGALQLSKLFKAAKQEAPSLIFIDQIENICRTREKDESSSLSSLRAALRLNMDELSKHTKDIFYTDPDDPTVNRKIKGDQHKYVIIVGATTNPASIDAAILRTGRFDRHIELTKPDLPGRLAILQLVSKLMKLNSDVDLEIIADKTIGFVGADLEALCSDAGLHAIRRRLTAESVMAEDDKDMPKHYAVELRVPKALGPDTLTNLEITQQDFLSSLETKDLRSGARQDACTIPKVTWDDIGGHETVKKALIEQLEYPLEFPHLFKKFGMAVQKGVLLYGPPGCGKTLLAEAVAKECKAHFIAVNVSKLMSPYFGQSEKNIRDLFDRARQNAPCVLFFDELDSLAKARAAGGSTGDSVSARIVTQLLCELDGAGEKKGNSNEAVFCIGATNRPDLIDPALLRPGRFDLLTYVGLPSLKSRVSILNALMKDTPLAADITENAHEYFQKFAAETKGYSGADISVICNRARKDAMNRYIQRTKTQTEMGNFKVAEDSALEVNECVCIDDMSAALSNVVPSVSTQEMSKYRSFKQGTSPGNEQQPQIIKSKASQDQGETLTDYDKRASEAIRKIMQELQPQPAGQTVVAQR